MGEQSRNKAYIVYILCIIHMVIAVFFVHTDGDIGRSVLKLSLVLFPILGYYFRGSRYRPYLGFYCLLDALIVLLMTAMSSYIAFKIEVTRYDIQSDFLYLGLGMHLLSQAVLYIFDFILLLVIGLSILNSKPVDVPCDSNMP